MTEEITIPNLATFNSELPIDFYVEDAGALPSGQHVYELRKYQDPEFVALFYDLGKVRNHIDLVTRIINARGV